MFQNPFQNLCSVYHTLLEQLGGLMKNYVFGYARVSRDTQNLDRQIDALKKYGVDKIYNEKMTGTRKDRPELSKLLDRISEGDAIVIESLSRLGRSTKDLIELTELFEQKEVHLVSLKEQIDTSTSTGELLFTLISAIAQYWTHLFYILYSYLTI